MTTQVLICDDSGFARRQMARSIPDGWDVDIAFAENGQQAIDLIREGKGDVLFLDLNMPVMDGYAATREIRKLMPEIPIIGMTANAMDDDKMACLAAGMNDHIAKPIDPESLIRCVQDVVNRCG